MRLSRYEVKQLRHQKRKAALEGQGVYVFRNNTSGELFLPRPTKSGITRVPVNEEFQGDDYYMFMVRNNELRLVRQIEAPPKPTVVNEQTENTMSEDKLITEQPPVVTNEGTVEFVEKPKNPQQKLNENQPAEQPQDILLNENPMDGIEII